MFRGVCTPERKQPYIRILALPITEKPLNTVAHECWYRVLVLRLKKQRERRVKDAKEKYTSKKITQLNCHLTKQASSANTTIEKLSSTPLDLRTGSPAAKYPIYTHMQNPPPKYHHYHSPKAQRKCFMQVRYIEQNLTYCCLTVIFTYPHG